jgi:hypothetical protein
MDFGKTSSRYGNEAWIIRRQEEMKLLRKTTSYSLLDHKRDGLMTRELKTTPRAELTSVKQKSAAAYKSNGTLQTSKSYVSVVPKRRRSKGRPPKRWWETATGH